MTQYDLSLRDYWRIVRRRKWLVIAVAIAGAVFSFATAFLLAPNPLYQATAAIRFERSLNVAGLLLNDVLNISPVGDLETQAVLITGFPVMGRAAKKLGLIPPPVTPDEIRASARYQEIVNDLAGQVEVKRSAETSLIEITVTSSDPPRAAELANRVAEAFREENIASRTQQIVEARQFIETQLDEVGHRLRESEERMKAFQESDRLLPIPDEARATASRLAALEAEDVRIKKEIGATEAQLQVLQTGGPGGRRSRGAPDSDPALAKLYASLSELTVERDNLLLTLLPTHPLVKGADARIANVRQSLIQALSAKLEGLRADATEARKALASVRAEQAALPAAALEATRIERDVKVNERIFSLLKERLQEVLIKEREQGAEVSIVRPAIVPTGPINPVQPKARAQVGLVIGLLMGLLFAFVVETLDTSIGAIDEVEALMETRVLGVIPELDPKLDLRQEPGQAVTPDGGAGRHPFLTSLFVPKSRLAEAFRSLRTSLVFATREHDLKTIVVTSGAQTEGKTTVAINLAITLAQLGQKTLLVEADLRRPFVRHAFGLEKGPGLTEVVLGSASLGEVTLGFADLMLGTGGMERLLDSPGMDNFFVLLSGYPPANPSELLSSQGLVKVLTEARQQYDYVILDSSPILPVPDAAILGSRADGALLVIRVGHMPRVALRRAKALLDATSTRLLGVCLSGVRADLSSDYAEMASYGYRYGSSAEAAHPRPKRGLLAEPRRRLRGAALVVALLGLTAGVWRWHSVRVASSVARTDAAGPASTHARAGAPKAPEPSPPPATDAIRGTEPGASLSPPPVAFTVRLPASESAEASDPSARTGVAGTVSIGQFGTRAEAEAYGHELVRAGLIKIFTVVPLSAAEP